MSKGSGDPEPKHWLLLLAMVGLVQSNCDLPNLYIYFAWVYVCLFVSNKRQNGWTERAQIFFGSLVWFQGRFINDQIFKNFPLRKFDFWKFWKSTKFILFLFYNVYSENMFTIEKEDGRSLVFIFITKYTLQKFSFFLSNILFKYFLFRRDSVNYFSLY